MAGNAIVFAGKSAFASVGTTTSSYLTVLVRREANRPTLYFPAMLGSGQAGEFAWILYATADGTLRIQLPDPDPRKRMWIAYDATQGNLDLTTDQTQAAAVTLSGTPPGQGWQIASSAGPLTVGYYPDLSEPVLTTNSAEGFQPAFAPTVVTPSPADIVKAGGCRGADLTNVVLAGVSLAGADLTGAKFTGASLVGIELTGAVLDQADMTQATLGSPSWGAPASAKGLILTQCSAAGAVLGGQAQPLDCSGATLSGGDFSGANLRGLILSNPRSNPPLYATAAGAIMTGADLTSAILDGADLSNVVAMRAILRRASLKNVRGPNAVLIRADLSNADLSQAQLGAKTYLFQIAGSLAEDLGSNAYPTTALIAAFAHGGVTLSPEAPITVLVRQARWEIGDPQGPYLLMQVAAGIDVFLAAPNLTPAVLRGATCLGTKAPGAGLSGADLRGVSWYGSGATLDHADLENACLADSLLASTDFTQAFLSGADLSKAVLAQATFQGCNIGTGVGSQPFSLEGAQIQGCDFTNANLRGALLVDAGVSFPEGVPLFVLPGTDAQYLTQAGLATLSPKFTAAGYPLGASPSVSFVQAWSIDNSKDPLTSDPAHYLVRSVGGQLEVFDGVSNTYYFSLPTSDAGQLNAANPSQVLISAFCENGYGLVTCATITKSPYWSIQAGADAAPAEPFGYRLFTVVETDATLTVFGSTLLLLRDWPEYPGDSRLQRRRGSWVL